MNAEKASKLLLSMAREHERAEDGTMRQNDTSKSTASRSRSWEPSNEVDLGLIGLNLFIGDSDLDENIGAKDDSEIDFVSFWEEAKLLEEEEKRRYVFCLLVPTKHFLRDVRDQGECWSCMVTDKHGSCRFED